jgi:hypothetical protein
MKRIIYYYFICFLFLSFISVGNLMAKFNDNTPYNGCSECDTEKWAEFHSYLK